jgi:hypothetical protein
MKKTNGFVREAKLIKQVARINKEEGVRYEHWSPNDKELRDLKIRDNCN